VSIPNVADFRDEDLRALLFNELVKRFDAKALGDPSITVVNRMPTVFAISRGGNLLTLSQGIGLMLLRGDLKWKNRLEPPRHFSISRAAIQSRLIITPDRIEDTPDPILDHIVAMFLDSTAAAPERPPAAERRPITTGSSTGASISAKTGAGRPSVTPSRSSAIRPTTRVPPRRDIGDRPSLPTGSTQQRPPAAPRAPGGSPPAPVRSVPPISTKPPVEGGSARQTVGHEGTGSAAAPDQATSQDTVAPTRTYQLLFETAQREFAQASAQPADSRYFLISAGVFVALTAEAFLNDIGSRVIPSWSQLQRLDPREKAEVLSIELFNEKVNWRSRPFQSIAAAFGFRRALAHAHAETLPVDQARFGSNTAGEVPRTRQTAWREHCSVDTMRQWLTDVHLVIAHFSKAHDSLGR
jgi:hypothetical protein